MKLQKNITNYNDIQRNSNDDKTKVKFDKALLDKNAANWISSYSAFKSSNGVALHEVTIL